MRIINIPQVNGLGKTKGVELAGDEIKKELKEIYSNSSLKPINYKKIKIDKLGLSNDDLIEDNKNIYDLAFESFNEKEKIFFIGGDHSMSYSTTRAFFDWVENKGREPVLIVFDAHPDLMEPVDGKIPTHEEWLKGLVNDGFKPQNILLVGLRNMSIEEKKFLEKNNMVYFTAQDLMFDFHDKLDSIVEFSEGRDLYLSIDIDCVDPAFAPGVGYREVGGMSSRELLYFLKRASKVKNLRAVDLVEVNPRLDRDWLTAKLGAKILSEFI